MTPNSGVRQRGRTGGIPRPDVILLGGLAAAAHLVFSPLGFNPTDDGFVLAMSRRLLEGEVPHRDFISIRPVLSAMFHMPLVALGGAATHWLGRLVAWCEFALIAWIWVRLLGELMGRQWSFPRRALYVCIGFVLSAHTFPVMPWYTVDGLLLGSAGLLLAAPWRAGGAWLGLALVGAAGLCKQNFFALIPIALWFSGSLRRAGFWLAALAPSLLYAGYTMATGASRDAVTQLSTATNVLTYGVWPYLGNHYVVAGVVAGYVISRLSRGGRDAHPGPRAGRLRVLGLLLACVLVLAVGADMLRGGHYLFQGTFLLFGAALAATVEREASRGWRDGHVRAGALVLLVAWATSVSLGYCSPALMAGALTVYLLASVTEPSAIDEQPAASARLGLSAVAALAVLLAPVWVVARLTNVYRDRPARELRYRLDDVLPGGKFLRTNRHTYEMMADLHRAIALTGGRPFAIVPDFVGYWVKAPQRNPLAIDFVNSDELGRPSLVAKLMAQLEGFRDQGFLIVDKADARLVQDGFVPLEEDNHYYPIVGHVRSHFTKVGETEWFELYH
jgi:hypothetical protein